MTRTRPRTLIAAASRNVAGLLITLGSSGGRLIAEDALDDGGILGRSGAEVAGRGIDGGLPE